MVKDAATAAADKGTKSIHDTFTVPTRGESVLDLILSREPELVSNVEVKEKLGNSDHNMLTFQVHLDLTARDSTTKHRDYKKGIMKVGEVH